MRESLRVGVAFGLTSGVITTMGLMVGLTSGTHSRAVVLGGILTIAVADAFSDALGIHLSEESENRHTAGQIWGSTVATFLSKFLFAMTFVIPVALLPLTAAVVVSLIWGFSALTVLSYVMAKVKREAPWKIIAEHLIIGALVITITHYVGHWVAIVTA